MQISPIKIQQHNNLSLNMQASAKSAVLPTPPPRKIDNKIDWILLGKQRLISFNGKYTSASNISKAEKVDFNNLKRLEEKPSFVVDLLVTHSCNMHCPHCVDEFVNQSDEIVSLDKVEEFFTKLKNDVSDKWQAKHNNNKNKQTEKLK